MERTTEYRPGCSVVSGTGAREHIAQRVAAVAREPVVVTVELDRSYRPPRRVGPCVLQALPPDLLGLLIGDDEQEWQRLVLGVRGVDRLYDVPQRAPGGVDLLERLDLHEQECP